MFAITFAILQIPVQYQSCLSIMLWLSWVCDAGKWREWDSDILEYPDTIPADSVTFHPSWALCHAVITPAPLCHSHQHHDRRLCPVQGQEHRPDRGPAQEFLLQEKEGAQVRVSGVRWWPGCQYHHLCPCFYTATGCQTGHDSITISSTQHQLINSTFIIQSKLLPVNLHSLIWLTMAHIQKAQLVIASHIG